LGETPELIAEIGSVHDGSIGNAMRLMDLAKDVGADTVKFQLHIPEAETTRSAPSPSFFFSEGRFDYFKRTQFSEGEWSRIGQHAVDLGISLLVSVFSESAAKCLLEWGHTRIKIPSGELDNRPLIDFLAESKCDLILSAGMSVETEIERTMQVLRDVPNVVLMQCTSLYPCPPELSGVSEIEGMIAKWGPRIGFSDHTSSNTASTVAAALGAVAIEKHLTFSRWMYGSDAPYACEPDQFRLLADAIREAAVLGSAQPIRDDRVSVHLSAQRQVFRHGVVASRDLPTGTVLKRSDLESKKPADGIEAWYIDEIVGMSTNRALRVDEALHWEDVSMAR
jgi:N,N'-diacetyllegionaminate synthase